MSQVRENASIQNLTSIVVFLLLQNVSIFDNHEYYARNSFI